MCPLAPPQNQYIFNSQFENTGLQHWLVSKPFCQCIYEHTQHTIDTLLKVCELPILQGKAKEDVRRTKEGFGQLLLAMFAVFIKFGKPVWGVALSSGKVSNNLEY